ncbi:MAG: hypothetical protein ACPGNT_07005, partial [Rhodospirillales bacterium]
MTETICEISNLFTGSLLLLDAFSLKYHFSFEMPWSQGYIVQCNIPTASPFSRGVVSDVSSQNLGRVS